MSVLYGRHAANRRTFSQGGGGRRTGPPRVEDRVMTFVRRAPTLIALAALSLSLVGPTTASLAGNGTSAWGCSPAEIAAAAAGSGAEARAPSAPGASVDGQGLVRDRNTSEVARDLPKEARGRAPSNFSATVPVYWHVVTDGAAGAVTDARSAARSA